MNLFDEGTKEIEYRIAELHKMHKGQLPEDAEFNYLEHARKLPLYGIYTFRTIVSSISLKRLSFSCSLGCMHPCVMSNVYRDTFEYEGNRF